MPTTRTTPQEDDLVSKTSTKFHFETLTTDGDWTDFKENFKAEMICRGMVHHFPEFVSEEMATKFREADKNVLVSSLQAQSLLILALDADMKSMVREAIAKDDPAILWEALREVRESQNDTTIAKIANQAASAKQGQSEPLVTYINRLDQLHRRITGTEYESSEKVMWLNLKRGLLPSFDQLARETSRDPTKKTYAQRRTDLIVTAVEYVGDPYKPTSTTYEGRALNTEEDTKTKSTQQSATLIAL